MVAFPLLDWIEICPLEILDQREREQRPVISLLDDGRDLFPAEVPCCTQTPLTGNELEAILAKSSSHSDGLKQAAGIKAFLELGDRKSTRLNSSHRCISYAVFCLKKKK